jgi:outer membrane protein assembly factor BamB
LLQLRCRRTIEFDIARGSCGFVERFGQGEKKMRFTFHGSRNRLAQRLLAALLLFALVWPVMAQLAKSPWPKFHANAMNTGQGAGSGAVGVLKWSFKTGDQVSCSPAIGVDGTVYIGSYDHNVYALDGATGTKKWSFTTGDWVISSPAIGSNGLVYVSSWDHSLYALDGASGALKWSYAMTDRSESPPAIGPDGTVYVGCDDGNLYAVAGSTGDLIWSFKTGGKIRASPAIGKNGSIYFGSADHNLYAVNGLTGKLNWSFEAGDAVWPASAIGADGTVYVGSNDYKEYALDGATGSMKWSFATNGFVLSSAAIGQDGTVYFGSQGNNLYAVNGASGVLKWVFNTSNSVQSSPTLGSDGTVYVGCYDEKLYSIDGTTGAVNWSYPTAAEIVSSPSIGADGTVYVGSLDGTLYAMWSTSLEAPPTSLTLNPTTVSGGAASTGMVRIGSPAPVGGLIVQLRSNSPCASVPATAVFAAGTTEASFTVNTLGVAAQTKSTISAISGGITVSATLTINPPGLSSVTLSPPTVWGGNATVGTVTLTGQAVTVGIPIVLSTNNLAATTPASVTVEPGKSTATFAVTTSSVTKQQVAAITAGLNGATQSATLTINPTILYSVSVDPGTVPGGQSSVGSIVLTVPAPVGGAVISLASNNSSVNVPASVQIAAGHISATFVATTAGVSASASVTITGTCSIDGGVKWATLTVLPAASGILSISPSAVVGGTSGKGHSATGTVKVAGSFFGTWVFLSSNTGTAHVPASINLGKLQTTAQFSISTIAVASQTLATIGASSIKNGQTGSAVLTINPVAIAQLSFSPATVLGGTSTTGTVTLLGPAESAGTLVTLSCNSPLAIVPATVLVPANQSSVSFTVNTTAVSNRTIAEVSASAAGVLLTSPITIDPLSIASLTLDPSTVFGGNSSTATVSLNGPATSGGAKITLSSNSTTATVPVAVTVPEGQTFVSFQVSTSAVSKPTVAAITASLNGGPQTANLTVNPIEVTSLQLSASTVVGGSHSTGFVTLNSTAPRGGVVVKLSSSDESTTVPVSVIVPQGKSSASFIVSTKAVTTLTLATITASTRFSSVTAILSVEAPSLQSLTLNPTKVKGGATSYGTVTLTGPAPVGGLIVSLSSSQTAATVPYTVTIAAGKTTASFAVKTQKVNSTTSATISGTISGVTASASLTII